METTSFCSCYRVAYSSRLPPARTVSNPFSFFASLNPKPLLSNRRNGRCSASSKTTTSSSPWSHPTKRITCGGAVREINQTEFPDVVLTSARPVLVEFIATWCGPCRLIAPAVESIAQEYNDKLTVVKIDHDSNPGLIEEYKVYGLPTLILLKNGKEVPESRREGAITQAKLKEYIDSLLESLTVA